MKQITKLDLELSLVIESDIWECRATEDSPAMREEEHKIISAKLHGLSINTDLLYDLICEHLQELIDES